MAPFLIAVSPVGAGIQPQGAAVNPTDISVGSVGAVFNPQGKVIAPTKYAWNPVGRDITPPDKKGTPFVPRGAKPRPPSPLFAASSPSAAVSAATGGSGNNNNNDDASADVGRMRRRVLLSSEETKSERGGAAAGGGGQEAGESREGNPSIANAGGDGGAGAGDGKNEKIVLDLDDPLDLSGEFPDDYRNWAAVLSQVLLKKEGFGIGSSSGSSERRSRTASAAGGEEGETPSLVLPSARRAAVAGLERLMLATHGHLAKAASGEDFLPRFHLRDPVFEAERGGGGLHGVPTGLPPLPAFFRTQQQSGEGANASASSTETAASRTVGHPLAYDATFFNFSPCVISESATGSATALTGLNIAPSVLNVAITALSAQVTGERKREERERDPSFLFAPPRRHLTPTPFSLKSSITLVVPSTGINLAPQLIFVNMVGAQTVPQGESFFFS